MSKSNNKFSWNDSVSLKEYFDNKFDDLEEKINLQFTLNNQALDKAENTTNLRLESMNEFRNAMKDQSNKYMTKDEYEIKHQLIEAKIDSLQKLSYMLIGALAIIEFAFKFLIR